MRAAAVSGKRSQSCITSGGSQRIFLVQRHPLRTLGQVGPDDCDVIAHGIDAVIVCGHPTIFSPAKPEATQALPTGTAGRAAAAERVGQDDDGGTRGHVDVGGRS